MSRPGRVVFTQPFTFGQAPEVYPAGVYEVEIEEQPLEAGAPTAHVGVSTVLTIPTASGTYCREPRGSDLDEAISRNAQRAGTRETGVDADRGDGEGVLR